jgi:hypothetical protein
MVTFRWNDYARGNKHRLMTLTAEEFLRRFLLHTLPRSFVRIRFFGFLANRQRTALLTPLPPTAGSQHSVALAVTSNWSASRKQQLGLSALRRPDAGYRKAHCPTDPLGVCRAEGLP